MCRKWNGRSFVACWLENCISINIYVHIVLEGVTHCDTFRHTNYCPEILRNNVNTSLMISKMIRYFFFFFLQNDPICYLRQLIFLEHIHPNPQMGKSVFLIAPRNVQRNWVLGRLYLNKRNNQYYQAKAFPFRPSHLKITKQIIYFPVILQVSPTKLTFTFMAEKFT